MKGKKINTEKLQSCLTGVSYPASKDELVKHVKSNCGTEVADIFEKLPEKQYTALEPLTSELKSLHLLDIDINL